MISDDEEIDPMADEKPDELPRAGSINEPPGSNVTPPVEDKKPEPKEGFKRELLPSDSELHKMTRAELDELAEERGVDISDASNKDEVIEALRKDARKRR